MRIDRNSLKGLVFFKYNNFSAESITMILLLSSLWPIKKSLKLYPVKNSFILLNSNSVALKI